MVRSAMEPDTMVAAVAQNTVWNTTYTHRGRAAEVVAAPDEGVKPADQRAGAAEHQAEAHDPEAGCPDTKIYHILHENMMDFWPG